MTTPGWYARGPKGSSILTGSTAPASDLGADGDSYLRITAGAGNGDLYAKASGSWSVVGNIQGPEGEPGSSGNNIVARTLRVGPTDYDASIPSSSANSSIVAIDRVASTDDASILLRTAGIQKWEIGAAGDADFHVKQVTGSDEATHTYTDVFMARYSDATARVDTKLGVGAWPAVDLHVVKNNSAGQAIIKAENTATSGSGSAAISLAGRGGTWSLANDVGQNGGDNLAIISGTIAWPPSMIMDANHNVGIGGDISAGGGQGVTFLANRIAAPTTNPSGGALLYAEGGELYTRSAAGSTSRVGAGDASTNTATSVDSEVAVFSGTGGKTLKRATGSGIAKLTSGVLGTATAGTDYYAPGGTDVSVADGGTGVSTLTGIVKGNGTSAFSAATAGTDYVAPGGALGTPSGGTLTNCTGLPVAGIAASTSTALGVGSVELGHASDTTLTRNSAGVLAVEGNTVPVNTTSAVHTAGTIELGHASDTTLSRSAAGVLAVEGVAVPTVSSTNTLSSKRITPRVSTISSSATPAINTDNCDVANLLSLATNVTSFTTSLTGTPTDGDRLMLRIKSTSAQTLSWGTSFQSSGVATLPTTTVAGKTHHCGFMWDAAASKWTLLAVDSAGY